MAKKTTSAQKMSKKEKRELDLKRRVTWRFSPVSRVKAGKKVYKRLKDTRIIQED